MYVSIVIFKWRSEIIINNVTAILQSKLYIKKKLSLLSYACPQAFADQKYM